VSYLESQLSVLSHFTVLVYFFFFFSSRRRHTRFSRDWSSDVCSSDLRGRALHRGVAAHRPRARGGRLRAAGRRAAKRIAGPRARSEERRVGKECRSRWWPERERQKNRVE